MPAAGGAVALAASEGGEAARFGVKVGGEPARAGGEAREGGEVRGGGDEERRRAAGS